MPKKTSGGPAKLYRVGDKMLTLKECAARCYVSPATLNYRLKKCANMEEAMKYYMEQNRRNATTDEEVAMLMSAIMGPDPEEAPPEPETKAEPAEIPAEEPTVELVIGSDIINLRAYNRLIEAMGAMEGVPMDDAVLADQLRDLCEQLRGMRCRIFDRLVDWKAIAEGSGQA